MRNTWRLVLAGSIALVSSVWCGAPARADDDEYLGAIPGEFVIELEPDGDPRRVAASLGLVHEPEPLGDGSPIFRIRLDPNAPVADTVARLQNTEGIEAAQPNLVQDSVGGLGLRKGFFGDVGPAKVLAGTSTTLAQRGVRWPVLAAGAGAGTIVAVLDTGIDASHPAFAGRVVPGIDLVDDDADPAEETNGIDDNGDGTVDEAYGHGTYVAGLVALAAPGARILPVRVLDTDGAGSAWEVMQGVAHAVAVGADVINLSLGGPSGGPITASVVERAQQQGAILVAAAGNEASDRQTYPAAFAGVLGVAAIDARTGAAASFTNRGSWVQVAAPGVSIVSAYPGGRTAVWGGTSAAAPLVAGLAAAVRPSFPGAPASDVVAAITGTASAVHVSGLTAYGTVVPSAALAEHP